MDAVKIYEEFRDVYRDGKNPPKREYTKGHFKKRSRVRHMINVIVELSKYVILTLMVIYTFHCFYLVKQQSEEERNESLRQQLMLIFFMDFTAFLVIYLKTGKFQVVLFLYRNDGIFCGNPDFVQDFL